MNSADAEAVSLAGNDGHEIRALLVTPADGSPAGLIQVLHGLGEHSGRYRRFAEAAADRQFAVIVHDHRGHGSKTPHYGYFVARDGWQQLVDDALLVQQLGVERFGAIPLTLLGHSMGSFVAQQFAMQHGERLAALLLSGSNRASRTQLLAANLLAREECLRLGEQAHSPLLDKLGFGSFNKAFEPARTPLDWLSRDGQEVDRYMADPLCGGPYTAGLWRDLTNGLLSITSDDALARIPHDLPILISGGSDDPVGGDAGMGRLMQHYAQTGHQRLSIRIYPGGRHEMLNETNRDEVINDWLDWIEAVTT